MGSHERELPQLESDDMPLALLIARGQEAVRRATKASRRFHFLGNIGIRDKSSASEVSVLDTNEPLTV